MKFLVRKLLFFICLSCLFSNSYADPNNRVIGKVVRLVKYGNFYKIEIRIDCKNLTCDIENFWYRLNDIQTTYGDLLLAQSLNHRIAINYDNIIIFNVIGYITDLDSNY